MVRRSDAFVLAGITFFVVGMFMVVIMGLGKGVPAPKEQIPAYDGTKNCNTIGARSAEERIELKLDCILRELEKR